MTKLELASTIHSQLGGSVPKNTILKILDLTFTTISDTLNQKGEIKVLPLGTFKIIEKKPRTGRNPKTGEPIQIPAKKVVKFKPYKNLINNT